MVKAKSGTAAAVEPLRYVTIHGHFYQPPRENPWLETVETQDSAAPYHDWNDRITAECYAPNGASRIVNRGNQIVRILNNYARISFNFGPTLLSWLEQNTPRAYYNILDADRRSQARFGGHGSAMAQAYNHIILPLANTRDRITQIHWGIADFESRFGRKPEGMWLAETAVDSESLELMAERGILFTVLAPSQCAGVRRLGESLPDKDGHQSDDSVEFGWEETSQANVDTTHPYVVRLKLGRQIAIFFYDGPRSRAIAFEGLLNSGDNFAARLLGGFRPDQKDGVPRAQLSHVATDGESYGHHHRYGEMALSYALALIEQKRDVRLTNYGEFLHKFPPKYEAQIVENTSWSCFHGVERWRSDCGCNGGKAGWNQKWRAPLREALDWLRDSIAPLTEAAAKGLFTEVWQARDAYIAVVLARGRRIDEQIAAVDQFFKIQSPGILEEADRVRGLKLMEMQRHALLMYTSCGWFFDDISGIETVQIIAYAGRVLQLAAEVFGAAGAALEPEFIRRLAEAKSNDPAAVDGGQIYLSQVRAGIVGLEEVAAHYAISSIFTAYSEETSLFGYRVRRLEAEALSTGRAQVLIGRALVSSTITGEAEAVVYAVLHFGDQNITAAVKRYTEVLGVEGSGAERAQHEEFVNSVRTAAAKADIPAIVRLFDRHFGETAYSITSLFRDEQRRIVNQILEPTVGEIESTLGGIYERNSSLLQFLSQGNLPKPEELMLAAGFSINTRLRHALEAEVVDDAHVRSLIGQAKELKIALDDALLGFVASERMKRAMVAVLAAPGDLAALEAALQVAETIGFLPFETRLWQAQNIWHEILELIHRRPLDREALDLDSADVAAWTGRFRELGGHLGIAVDQLVVEDDGVRVAVPVVG